MTALLSEVVRGDNHFNAAIRAIEEADRLQARVERLEMDLKNAYARERVAKKARDKWRKIAIAHEWALGIRR